MKLLTILAALALLRCSDGQGGGATRSVREDPLTRGPKLEIVHYYDGQWPTGIAVSKTGRKFSCFPGGLDLLNVNNGLNGVFQVAELTSEAGETAYPNKSYNNPPLGAVNRLVIPPVTKGDPNHLLGVQSVVIDEKDTLWLLDTGRVLDLEDPIHPMLNSSPGGPKLVSIDLSTDKVTRTILFPSDVAYPTSYLNDVRFDRNREFAYISDSSLEGRNGIVVVNLKTGKSWRKLDSAPEVHAIPSSLPFVYGQPMYQQAGLVKPRYITFGADGIALSPDKNTLYFGVIGGRFLYSVSTSSLRDQGSNSEAQVKNLGEKGISDGFETDSNGIVYTGNAEQNGITQYNPLTGFATIFVRDPRINWVDTMSIAEDGYLYFTVNQLNFLNAIYPGEGLPLVDRRIKPYVAFRVKLPNGGSKIG